MPFAEKVAPGAVAEKSTAQLAAQADYRHTLGLLTTTTRRAPLSPEAFAAEMQSRRFSVPSDLQLVPRLYSKLASGVLGCIEELNPRCTRGHTCPTTLLPHHCPPVATH